MTAPRVDIPVTYELLERFKAYHNKHGAWGIFHVSLDDGNYRLGAADLDDSNTDEERELAAIFERLTPTQRRKIKGLCRCR